jgi:hypothetical protein
MTEAETTDRREGERLPWRIGAGPDLYAVSYTPLFSTLLNPAESRC